MTPINIRAPRFPVDYEAIVRLHNFIRPEPTTVEHFMTSEERRQQHNTNSYDEQGLLIGFFRERFVASTEDDQVVGYAEVNREENYHPGDLTVLVLVDLEVRNQGIGTALYDHIHPIIQNLRPTTVHAGFPDSMPASLAFAEKRGYHIERHLFNSKLEMATFDETPFAGLIEGVEASGIRFVTLDEWRTISDDRALYEAALISQADIPGSPPPPPYDDWHRVVTESPESFTIVALDGDRYVGLTQLQRLKVSGNGYNYFTGMNSEYRGRKISLALKLLAIRNAREADVPYITTFNDSENAPMLAINHKLGYQRTPGHYVVKKVIDSEHLVSESTTRE